MVDWKAIQSKYEQGASLRDVVAKVAPQADLCYNEASNIVALGGAANTPSRIHLQGDVSMDMIPQDNTPRNADWELIRQSFEQGASLREIAARYGSSPATILRRARHEQWQRSLTTHDPVWNKSRAERKWRLKHLHKEHSHTDKAVAVYSIYALIDPRDQLVRYVGMSQDVIRRFGSHLRLEHDESNPAKTAWISDLSSHVLLPILSVLETGLTFYDASRREKYWITYFAYGLDMPLVNYRPYSEMQYD